MRSCPCLGSRRSGEALADAYREAMRRRREWPARLSISGIETPGIIINTFRRMVGYLVSDAPASFTELLTHPEPLVRLHAARISELLIGEPAFTIIAEVISGDYSSHARKVAIQALGDIAYSTPAQSSKLLKDQLVRETDPEVLMPAIRAVQSFGSDMGHLFIPALKHVLDNSSPDVCCAACQELGMLGSGAADAIESLISSVTHRESSEVRKEAARALTRIDPEGERLAGSVLEAAHCEQLLAELAGLRGEGRRLWLKLSGSWERGGVDEILPGSNPPPPVEKTPACDERDSATTDRFFTPSASGRKAPSRVKALLRIEKWRNLAFAIDRLTGSAMR